MRIGFDLDGVLADMESELVRQAEILFGDAMTRQLEERATDPRREPVGSAVSNGQQNHVVFQDRQPHRRVRRRYTARCKARYDATAGTQIVATCRKHRELLGNARRARAWNRRTPGDTGA